jgi:hypothetical protein
MAREREFCVPAFFVVDRSQFFFSCPSVRCSQCVWTSNNGGECRCRYMCGMLQQFLLLLLIEARVTAFVFVVVFVSLPDFPSKSAARLHQQSCRALFNLWYVVGTNDIRPDSKECDDPTDDCCDNDCKFGEPVAFCRRPQRVLPLCTVPAHSTPFVFVENTSQSCTLSSVGEVNLT